MSQISCPEIFTDAGAGREVNAERLNNALGALTALPGLITEQASGTPAVADIILFKKVSTGVLSQSSFTALLAALMPTDPDAATAGMRTLGTTSVKAAAGNDTRFPALVTGIRKGGGNGSTDTAADQADLPCVIRAGGNSGTAIPLNCVDNLNHTVTMNDNATITLSNTIDGQIIRVKTVQDANGNRTVAFVGATPTLTAIKEGGAAAASTAANAIDIWTLERWGTVLHVSVKKAYA